MKLVIMRHAKAEKGDNILNDFDRPLAKRGYDDAKNICEYLKHQKISPEYILSSPSLRTKQTAEIVAKFYKKENPELNFNSDIYEASLQDLVHAIRNIPVNFKTAILIGHNPSVTGIIGYLSGVFAEHVSTAGVAVLKYKLTNWQLTNKNTFELLLVKNPKELQA